MSTDKSVTTATIKFYPNKHIEVEIDGLKNVHPRALAIANNLLLREYLGKRAKFNADQHKAARKAKKDEEAEREKEEDKFHEKEDERLALAAKKKMAGAKTGEVSTASKSPPKASKTSEEPSGKPADEPLGSEDDK